MQMATCAALLAQTVNSQFVDMPLLYSKTLEATKLTLEFTKMALK